jgi:hypothetical protein
MLRREDDKIVLCCGGKACPKLSTDTEDNITIEDDNGDTVTITREQAALIPQALKEI